MSTSVHPTAVVADGGRLGENVEIGPYCVIGPDVVLGDEVRLQSHVVIANHTEIGAGSTIYPFASIGQMPQDKKYKGEVSRLIVGERCQIREHVTMNSGTEGGGLVTRVGNDCLLMVGVHIAHDCQVGNNVIMANNATLAGHVSVGDYVQIGGLAAVLQFVRIGSYAMIGGVSGVENDVIPYGLVKGERAHLAGLNLIGLERRGFSKESIGNLRSAYKVIFASDGTLAERVSRAAEAFQADSSVAGMVDFIRTAEKKPLCQPLGQNG